jgi:lysyl endopeptidase
MNERKKYSFVQAGSILPYMFFFLFASHYTVAQRSYGGRPAGLPSEIREVPVIRMQAFNINNWLREREAVADHNLKSLVFAKSFNIQVEPSREGIWTEQGDGTRVWRIALQSGGAFSLNIIFNRFRLEPGVSVFVYNAPQTDILGSFTSRNNRPSGSLALAPVRGDKIIIEMQVESGVDNYGELMIGTLNHDFTGILDHKNGPFGLSGDCNIDINCPSGDHWQTEKNAVIRVTVNGNTLCTGVLVNNTSNDGKPYLLTANHCISDSSDAANSVFLFGYESPSCNGVDGSATNSLSGSALMATQRNLDFTLVLLDSVPPRIYRPWYAGWDRSATIPGNTVSIHHPQGDVKKITIDNDPPVTATYPRNGYTTNGHWRINHWETGTTEDGSSGSPLFDQDGFLRGLLTGGRARCGLFLEDYYCKFSLAWDRYEGISNQLKPWLDSLNTGLSVLQGINPYQDNGLRADFSVSTTGICLGDNVVFTDFSSGGIASWQWNFGDGANPPSASTQGPHLVEYSSTGERTASLTVWNQSTSDLSTLTFNLSVESEEIPVANFSYLEDLLTFQFTDLSQYPATYYWEFGDGNVSTLRNPVNIYQSEGEYIVRQLVRNKACADTSVQMIIATSSPVIKDPPKELRIYPVPATNFLTIDPGGSFKNNTVIELFSVSGQRLVRKEIPAGQETATLVTGKFPAGTYILNMVTGIEQLTFKITIIN